MENTMRKSASQETHNLKKSASHDVGLPPLLSKAQGYSVENPTSENVLISIMESSRTSEGNYSTALFKKKLSYTFLPDISDALREVVLNLPDEELSWDEFNAKIKPDKIFTAQESTRVENIKKKGTLIKKSPSTDVGLPPLLSKSVGYSIEPPTPIEKLTSIMEYCRKKDGFYSSKLFIHEISNTQLLEKSEKLRKAVETLGDDEQLTWDEFVAKINPEKVLAEGIPPRLTGFAGIKPSPSSDLKPPGLPRGAKGFNVKKSASQDVFLPPLATKGQLYSVEPPTSEERLSSMMEYARNQEGKYSMKIFKKEIQNSDLLDLSDTLKNLVMSIDDDEILNWNAFCAKVDPVKIFSTDSKTHGTPTGRKKGHSRSASLKSSPSMDLNLPPLVNKTHGYSVDPPSKEETLYSIMEYSKLRDGSFSMKEFLKEVNNSSLSDSPELQEALKGIDPEAKLSWDEFCDLVNPVKIFAQS